MITVIARIKAKADAVELVKDETLKLVNSTLKADGCIRYDLHQDNEDPACFFFYENWLNENAVQAHLKSDHMRTYLANTKNRIAEFSANKLTKLTEL